MASRLLQNLHSSANQQNPVPLVSETDNVETLPSLPGQNNDNLTGAKFPLVVDGTEEVGDEKILPRSENSSSTDAWADDHPAIKDLPPAVRRIVSLEDDPNLPTLTFRYFVLSVLFVVPGAFLSQMSSFRTTYAPYSVFFVQIASDYLGTWLAKVLPAWNMRVPFTRYGFSLNPGPWSVKEHVLVTISAASGATYNLAYAPISISELFFDKKINPAVAIFYMWVCVWTGYSFAAISRQFLLYDPVYPCKTYICWKPNALLTYKQGFRRKLSLSRRDSSLS